jgi:hypothetical protein
MADHCTSCGAPIEWVVTAKGSRMPLDLASSPDANIILDGLIARVVKPGEGVRTSHFASCPNADRHRKSIRSRR